MANNKVDQKTVTTTIYYLYEDGKWNQTEKTKTTQIVTATSTEDPANG